MAEAERDLRPLPGLVLVDMGLGPYADAMSSLASSEVGPDMTDDTPSEGRINGPVPTRGLEKRTIPEKTEAELLNAKRSAQDKSLEIRIGSADIEDRKYAHDDASAMRTQQSATEKIATEATDVSIGFEGMMHDITELIEVMPLENAVEENIPQPKAPLKTVMQEPGDAPPVTVHYDPSERPTSRWRCRWKLFNSQQAEQESRADLSDRLSSYVGDSYAGRRQPFTGDAFAARRDPCNGNERVDFRNPYIKALTATREELQKSWDLFSEATPASRMATERTNALASMHIVEVDNWIPQRSLACLPEPCRETCRENTIQHPEMCEVQIFQHRSGVNGHPHPGLLSQPGALGPDCPDVLGRQGTGLGGPSPRPARCEDYNADSGIQIVGDNEDLFLLANSTSESKSKYVREVI